MTKAMMKKQYIHPEIVIEPIELDEVMIEVGSHGAANGDGEGDYAKEGFDGFDTDIFSSEEDGL